MSNLDWIRTLSAMELVDWIYGERLDIARGYTDSYMGLVYWLNQEREEQNNGDN